VLASNTIPLYNPRMAKPTALSFFTGAMGLDLGLEQAGFDIRLASDINDNCQKTIHLNRPDLPVIGDICQFDAKDIQTAAKLAENDHITLVAGGPPCQAFSTMGLRKGTSDDRGSLSGKYISIVTQLRPDYIVMENVRGLLSIESGKPLAELVKKLEAAGYCVTFNLYDAANYGVPQNRERIIIVASLKGKTPYLRPTHSKLGIFNLPKWRTFREAVVGLTKEPMECTHFPESRLKYLRMLKAGQDWRNLPEGLQKEALGGGYESQGGRTSYYRRLGWDEPAPTMLTSPVQKSTMLCHPDEDRPLSVQEYMRVQQFPDDWKLDGKTDDKYRQIGNAVPVGLGRAIGDMVMAHSAGRPYAELKGFEYSRYLATSDQDWQGGIVGQDLFSGD